MTGDGIALRWEAPDDDSVTGYHIVRRRPELGETKLMPYVEDTGSTATAYTDADVEVGVRYVYRVKAVNAVGIGPRSNYVNIRMTEPPEPPPSTEATLSGLTLSDVGIGTFDSATTGYTASVANDVAQTTVTPTVNDDGATYVVQLDGSDDSDGTVDLAVGANAISIVVTAEDGDTTRTYTVTVTRAAPPLSTDATLRSLALSDVDIGTFDQATTGYTASVANDVAETTVAAATNDDGAAYEVKLDGTTDADGTVALAVGENVVAVEVTAEDGHTTKTYTVTVTRAEPDYGDTYIAAANQVHSFEEPGPHPDLLIFLIAIGPGSQWNLPEYSYSVEGLIEDSDPTTLDYVISITIRESSTGDIAHSCHGSGLTHYSDALYQVQDRGGEELDYYKSGTLNWKCAQGGYFGRVEILDGDKEYVYVWDHKIAEDGPPVANGAELLDLTLSGVDIGWFIPLRTQYTASVANDVTETTVTPTVNDDGATYVIKLDGVADADGTVSLAEGSNVITVEVTAEDGEATMTYTVIVTRAEALSTDATLSGLTLSGVDIGTFDPDTIEYTAAVGNDVTETTVTPTVNDDGATYRVWNRDGGNHADMNGLTGTVSLVEGSNVITIKVTAEDGQTTKTYTVTVTRARKLTASLHGPVYHNRQRAFAFDLWFSEYVEISYATLRDHAFNVTGGTVTNARALSNRRWKITVTPHGNEDVTIVLPATTDCEAERSICTADGRPLSNRTELTVPHNTPATGVPAISGTVRVGETLTADTSGISDADGMDNATFTYWWGSFNRTEGWTTWWPTGATYSVTADDQGNTMMVQVSFTDDGGYQETLTSAETAEVAAAMGSSDATLSGLALSGIDIGTFDPATTEYTADVGGDITETTVTPTVNDDGASYVVKLDGVADDDGTVLLSVGENAITIEVTAEDGNTVKTYTVAVTRAVAPLSTDAMLSDLALSGVAFGTFDPATTGYTASVTNDVERATVTATTNDDGATYVIQLNGVDDADGTVELAVGENTVSVVVTAEDGTTTKTYTVAVTRAVAPLSTDAMLSDLALSGVAFGMFDPATTGYTASVTNDVERATVTATTNDDGATYVIQLNGVDDADGTVELAVGENTVSVVVTAEDGTTTKTYTVAVTRAAAPLSTDATLSDLALSGVAFGTFDPATTGYTASVANDVERATVTATTNHDGAAYVVKLGGVSDADGTIELVVGENVTSVVVTAEDGTTTKTYTVTVTRAAAEPTPGSPPKAPDAPTGKVTGLGQVQLDWNDVEDATYYQVRFWWDSTEWVELPTGEIGIAIDGSGATVSNLPDYGFYYFMVRAGNAAGLSDWSKYLTLTNPR